MTTSRTGNNKGLTLIELMVAVAVLCLGSTLIQEGLLRSLSLLGRHSHTLNAEIWMDERLWQAKQDAFYSESLDRSDKLGEFTADGRSYNWSLAVMPLSGGGGLYSFKLSVFWTEDGRTVDLVKESYALAPT
jgi:prepilin-type N-terminal cleavage/methylation domain-containing protein